MTSVQDFLQGAEKVLGNADEEHYKDVRIKLMAEAHEKFEDDTVDEIDDALPDTFEAAQKVYAQT